MNSPHSPGDEITKQDKYIPDNEPEVKNTLDQECSLQSNVSWTRTVLTAIVLAVASGSAGCASLKRELGIGGSRNILTVSKSELNDPEIQKGVALWNLKLARGRVTHKDSRRIKNFHFNRFYAGIGFYRKALQYLADDDSQRANVEKELRFIRGKAAGLESEYEEKLDKLNELLELDEFSDELWVKEIQQLFDRLRVLKEVLEKDATKIDDIGLKFVRKIRGQAEQNPEKYSQADDAGNLTMAAASDELTDEEKLALAVVFAQKRAKEIEKAERIDELEELYLKAKGEKREEEITQYATELTEIDPDNKLLKPPKKKRRSKKKKKKNGGNGGGGKVGGPDKDPPPPPIDDDPEDPELESYEYKEVKAFIKKIDGLFASKKNLVAIRVLTNALKKYPRNPKLIEKRAEKQVLIDSVIAPILSEADEAFYSTRNVEKARDKYKEVIAIDPWNEYARDQLGTLPKPKKVEE